MRKIASIDSRYVISIDIETVRLDDKFSDVPESFQDAWTYKNKQAGIIPDQDELDDLWMRQSSLYAEFAKVCAVSMAFLDQEGKTLICRGIASTNEYGLLIELSNFLERIRSSNPNFRLMGHASFYFDFPFLSKRYLINGIAIPRILDETHLKPWEKMNLDTNDIWKCGGTGPGSSLQALCTVMDVPISKVDMVGDEVGREYFKGNISGIRDYCNKDAVATFNVFRRFKGESIFMFDEVVYMNDSDIEEAEVVPMSPLEKLREDGVLSNEVKNGLLAMIDPDNVTGDDLDNLVTIVTAHYLNKTDKVSEKKSKEAEVKHFIYSLIPNKQK